MTSWRSTFAQMAMGIVLVAFCHGAHLQLNASNSALPQRRDSKETLPSVAALRLMSLGYKTLVADYYWLRAVSHFGDRRMQKQLYPNLAPLLQRTVALDPLFAGAYVFAGQALTLNGMDWSIPMEMLQEGLRARPDDWRIGFFLGFNAYYFMQDYPLSTRALSAAAALPDAPPFVAPLASRLAAEAGTPELGISLMKTMLAGTEDPKLRAMYAERLTLLTLELRLRDLQQAVDIYVTKNGKPPVSLQALVDAKILDKVPPDPLGGAFLLAGSTVETTHSTQRLRLQPGSLFRPKNASD